MKSGVPILLPALRRTSNRFDIVVLAQDKHTIATYRLNLIREIGTDDFSNLPDDEAEYSLVALQVC
jgi:hypothetical protein